MDEARKSDQDKPRLELILPEVLLGMGRVLALGAQKYAQENYLAGDGLDPRRILAAAMRHLSAWHAGEDFDPEWGEHHLDHALCSVAMLRSIVHRHPEHDTRVVSVGARHLVDRCAFCGGGRDEPCGGKL